MLIIRYLTLISNQHTLSLFVQCRLYLTLFQLVTISLITELLQISHIRAIFAHE